MTLQDGYNEVPLGKIASVVTSLEMREPPPDSDPTHSDPPEWGSAEWGLETFEKVDLDRYRALYSHIGTEWLWFSRLTLSDEDLGAIVHDPRVEVSLFQQAGRDAGLLELDFREAGQCELAFLGLSKELVGSGAGRWLMAQAIAHAWSRPIERFWVHTCTLDHPRALSFYIRSGFQPFQRQIEMADDPRLIGLAPRDAAPHVPLLEPSAG